MSSFMLGTDPEFVLLESGVPISAINRVPGDKKNRHHVGQNDFYYDNALAECSVEPSRDRNHFVSNIKIALQQYSGVVRPATLGLIAAVHFSQKELDHPEAMKIACDPERCAYTLDEVNREDAENLLQSTTLRTAGGHIHVGSEIIKQGRNALFATRMFDLFLGTASIFIDKDPTSLERRKLFGRAGRYRKPDHGVEYRTLSNFWLASPAHVGFIWDMSEFVVDFVTNQKHLDFWEVDEETLADDDAWNQDDFDPANCHVCYGYDVHSLREAIDEHDKSKGQEFLDFVKELLPSKINDQIDKLAEMPLLNLYEEWNIV